jgi:hypothetical protein
VKFSTAAEVLPAFVTEAELPAAPVVTVPTITVAATPAAPVGPDGPVLPACASMNQLAGLRSGWAELLFPVAMYVEPL